MDEMRVCGNGHLFPFAAGSCPECDSVASRPATRAEIEAGGGAAAAVGVGVGVSVSGSVRPPS